MADRGSEFAVLCLDLDHFKLVNDTLGHPVGDGLLRAAADRLQACVREVDTVARLGGDEFAVIQLAVEQPDDAEPFSRTASSRRFGDPFEVEGHHISVGTSIGVTVAPVTARRFENVAEERRYRTLFGEDGGPRHVRFFEPEMDARIQRRRTLELDLRRRDRPDSEFEVYYQPLVNLVAGQGHRVRGVAAMAPSDPRPCLARGIHSGRRGNRHDRGDRRVGAADGLFRGGELAAGHQACGEPVAGPVQERQSRDHRAGRA